MFATAKIVTAFSAAALLGTAGIASAEEFKSNGRTTQVRHGDLNLAQPADQQKLRARIASAATRVCHNMDLAAMSACREAAIAHVEAPVATAIARAENGQRFADARR